jgi:hypothetical protein
VQTSSLHGQRYRRGAGILESAADRCGVSRSADAAAPEDGRTPNAFTLVEILVTIGLLSVIILGLMAMFNQTQRVFRTGLAQSDYLESGRATMESLSREIELATPSGLPPYYNSAGVAYYYPTNFYVEESGLFVNPILEGLPGTNAIAQLRTNYIQDIFFLSQVNQDWYGIGYAVLPSATNTTGVPAGVGTLYRYSSEIPKEYTLTNHTSYTSNIADLSVAFRQAVLMASNSLWAGLPVTNLSRIADGVAHLHVRAFATNGYPLVGYDVVQSQPSFYVSTISNHNAYFHTSHFTNFWSCVSWAGAGVIQDSRFPDSVYGCYFWSNAVPSSVEVELGMLEPQALRRYQALGDANLQQQYLSNHTAQVHLFRQRIPIRAADPTAYQ